MTFKRSLRVGAIVAVLSAAALSTEAVPVAFGGHYYEVVSSPGIDWLSAEAAAEALSYLGAQGHLATITSFEEDEFLDGLRGGLSELWVGGFQSPITTVGSGDNWMWVNGEGAFPGDNLGPVYANWLVGEPNDFYGLASEQYLAIGLGGAFGWNDEGAIGNISGYVVEYNVPEPGTLSLVGLGLASLAARRRRKA
jgi:hypothetical protein